MTKFSMNREPTIGKRGTEHTEQDYPSRDDGKVTLAPPRVTKDEEVELCIHHLAMAAMYYEATPDDGNTQIKAEAERMLLDQSIPNHVPPALAAGRAFLSAAHSYYEKLKAED